MFPLLFPKFLVYIWGIAFTAKRYKQIYKPESKGDAGKVLRKNDPDNRLPSPKQWKEVEKCKKYWKNSHIIFLSNISITIKILNNEK